MRVLVVEDELRMASLIRRGLVAEGLATDVSPSGEDALWMAEANDYDAIVLDVMLPGINGFETCRRLREAGIWTPVLMLTARDAVEDRVAGLDTGADDYLVKPFSFAELLARLRARVRRGEAERPGVGCVNMKMPGFAPWTPASQLPLVFLTCPCLSSSAVFSPKYQTRPRASWV
jgi:two-component system OmpR family response regulator